MHFFFFFFFFFNFDYFFFLMNEINDDWIWYKTKVFLV